MTTQRDWTPELEKLNSRLGENMAKIDELEALLNIMLQTQDSKRIAKIQMELASYKRSNSTLAGLIKSIESLAEQPLIFGSEDCDVDCVECQA